MRPLFLLPMACACFVLGAVRTLQATPQLPDVLLHDGQLLPLAIFPLEQLFELGRPKPAVLFSECGGTALHRGYVAFWSIDNGHLTLDLIKLCQADANTGAGIWSEVPLESILPDLPRPIRAEWFSGILVVGQTSMHGGESKKSQSHDDGVLLVSCVRGRVIGEAKLGRPGDRTLEENPDYSWRELTSTKLDPPPSPAAESAALNDGAWYDGDLLSSQFDALVNDETEIRLRGLYFGRHLWTGYQALYLPIAIPSAIELPPLAASVEVTGHLHRVPEQMPRDWYEFVVHEIRSLPPGTLIQHPPVAPEPHAERVPLDIE